MRSLSASLLLVLSLPALAVPTTVEHQGRLFDALGAAITTPTPVQFAIYEAETGGSSVWSETHTLNFDNGYFSVTLGETTPIDSSFVDGDDLWIGLTVDTGVEMPRLKLSSVPYAVYADSAVSVTGGGSVDASSISINGTTIIDDTGAFLGSVDASAVTGLTDNDTLAGITCADDEHLRVVSGVWSCGSDSDLIVAASQLSGTIDSTNLQFGTSSGTIASGDHSHTSEGGLRWSEGLVDFGSASTSDTQSLSLSNSSALDATGLAVGARNGFTVSSTSCGSTLAAGSNCDVDVQASGAVGRTEGLVVASSPALGSAMALLAGDFASPILGAGIDGNLTVSSAFDITAEIGGSGRSGSADGIAYAVNSVLSDGVDFGTAPIGLAAGDKALLIVMQGADPTDVGNYEVVDISSTSSSGVSFSTTIDTSRFDTGANLQIVLQRIPQYNNVNIASGGNVSASAWDRFGATAAPNGNASTGIVAFFATGTVTIEGTVQANWRGYRGGANNTDTWNASTPHGFYGEGITTNFYGNQATWGTDPDDGGGGGGWSVGGCCHGNGGGGAGYAATGGAGTIDGQNRQDSPYNGATTVGGATYGAADLGQIYLGAGGGGGGNHSGGGGACDTNDAECNQGGRGGGIVMIRADQIVNNGTVSANGENGYPKVGTAACNTRATINTQDGGGGSGAGGSVLLQATSSIDTASGTVTATGGPANCLNGWPTANHNSQRGGIGSDGRVRFEAGSITGTATPAASEGTF